MKELYVRVDFPDIQEFQEHPRFDECIPASTICNGDGVDVPSCTYFVPVDLYNEVIKNAFLYGVSIWRNNNRY